MTTTPLPVTQSQSDGTALTVDAGHNVPVVIDEMHHKVHTSGLWTASYFADAVGDNGTVVVLLQVSSTVHVRFTAGARNAAEIAIYEDYVISGGEGTLIESFNRDRTAASTGGGDTGTSAGMTVSHTPDPLSGSGTLIFNAVIRDYEQFFEEWILDAGEDYSITLTNRSGSAQPLSLQVDWYLG